MVHTLHITDLNLDKVHAARARVADTVRYIGNAIPLCTKKIEASGQPGTFHFLSYDGRTAGFDHCIQQRTAIRGQLRWKRSGMDSAGHLRQTYQLPE